MQDCSREETYDTRVERIERERREKTLLDCNVCIDQDKREKKKYFRCPMRIDQHLTKHFFLSPPHSHVEEKRRDQRLICLCRASRRQAVDVPCGSDRQAAAVHSAEATSGDSREVRSVLDSTLEELAAASDRTEAGSRKDLCEQRSAEVLEWSLEADFSFDRSFHSSTSHK